VRTIYKYRLDANDGQIDIHDDAKILAVGMQDGYLHLWAAVYTSKRRVTRKFKVFGTGWEIPGGAEYVGTFFVGPFVWHLHEVEPDRPRGDATGWSDPDADPIADFNRAVEMSREETKK
jgi:hypothetical protein